MSKVRIYDLAKELKLDNKKVIEEVRRFGYDVSVPSNSVPLDIAEKVKSKYFPQKSQAERRVKLIKHQMDSGAPISIPSQVTESPRSVTSQPPKVRFEEVIERPQQEVISKQKEEPKVQQVSQVKVVKKIETPIPAQTAAGRSGDDAAKPKIIRIEPSRPEQTQTAAPSQTITQPIAVSVESPAAATVPSPTPSEEVKPTVTISAPEPAPSPEKPKPAVEVAPEKPKPVVAQTPPPQARPAATQQTTQAPAAVQPVNKTTTVKPSIGGKPSTEPTKSVVINKLVPPPPVVTPPPPATPAGQNKGTAPVRTQIIPLKVQAQIPQPPQQRTAPQGQQQRPQHGQPQQNQPHKNFQRHGQNQQQAGQQARGQQDNRQQDNRHGHGHQGQRDRGQGYNQNQQPQQAQHQQQRLVSKPMQSFQKPPAAGEVEIPEGQRTTYIPPPDTRKKGRRTAPSGKQQPIHTKKEDREKLPMRHIPSTVSAHVVPKVVVPKELKPIKLVEGSTVKEFAEKLDVKPKDVVSLLLGKGVMATINQTLNADVAKEIAKEFGYDLGFAAFEEMTAEAEVEETLELLEDSTYRAPVVTVMGHVDHGKTSLLDAIRKTRVAEGEAGGITQHIGAYSVEVADPDNPEKLRKIVFLDTPGHEAFTMMRARGAKVTDVVVLVVAADDGVMPQTIEAIEHAKAAGVPIVVAINKIDKAQAQPDRVKQALSEHGLLWDGWGGDTVMVEVSAKQRINLNALLEMIILTADILDLKANPKRLGTGVVLEAKLDKGRGSVATVLVQNGTLKVGDPIIAGLFFGRVRAMFDDRGRQVQETGPSTPAEVLGLQGVPSAGDQIQVVTDAAKAQQISTLRQSKKRMLELSRSSAQRLEDLFGAMQAGKLKELLVIIKADVQGSVEVLRDTLQKLSTDKVKVRVIRSGVGAITESDVLLAAASNDMAHTAVIIGFNVRPEQRAEELGRMENVDIRLHTIIYKIEEEIRNAMIGMLDATVKEVVLGKAEVRKVIKIPKAGNIGGCMVIDGLIKRTAKARLLRDGVVVYEGQISSLRRFKEDASEVKQGFECGIGIEKFSDLKLGDIIEAYIVEKVAATEL